MKNALVAIEKWLNRTNTRLAGRRQPMQFAHNLYGSKICNKKKKTKTKAFIEICTYRFLHQIEIDNCYTLHICIQCNETDTSILWFDWLKAFELVFRVCACLHNNRHTHKKKTTTNNQTYTIYWLPNNFYTVSLALIHSGDVSWYLKKKTKQTITNEHNL